MALHPVPSHDHFGDCHHHSTSAVERLLAQAEHLLGDRDRSWLIQTFEAAVQGGTRLSFPAEGAKVVFLLLSRGAATPIQVTRQLAHQVIHLLDPHQDGQTSTLEEGVAVWFGQLATGRAGVVSEADVEPPGARRALRLVEPLMAAPWKLRRWRMHSKRGLSQITAEDLLTLYPSLTPEEAAALAAPFDQTQQEPT
ncbi:hypothetical protein [Deinococcus gobiensis]|uniref:Uncharacterized protein n=1 Tax=Deinococcus gobiensis (strain DSM 21396 / JCM 16679 / CGMCC 1.7299 / I-0) TaxID=745776 RepID=H8H2Q2_DEIGI|nr:hypothetical protein DGo_PC0007 [Deinococcus gobiensis I-0]